jgi:hypothetical protein
MRQLKHHPYPKGCTNGVTNNSLKRKRVGAPQSRDIASDKAANKEAYIDKSFGFHDAKYSVIGPIFILDRLW